jgi:hypothetical protein
MHRFILRINQGSQKRANLKEDYAPYLPKGAADSKRKIYGKQP